MDHSLNLDKRQRDMLAAMGVTYWWPETTAAANVPPADHTATSADASTGIGKDIGAAIDTGVATGDGTLTATATNHINKVANIARPKSAEAHFDSKFEAATAPPAVDLANLSWPALNHAIEHCQACSLCAGRKQTIPGTGNPRARWMIVDEAPDDHADAVGQPMSDQAGQLLDAMLAAMGLDRAADVYITHVIKCPPPHNRNPVPAEVAQCQPYLQRQMALLQPDMVVALGRFAAQGVWAGRAPTLDTLPLGKLRGQVHMAGGYPMVVTYHPSYLLRSPAKKGDAWQDLCLAMAHVGHHPLGRRN